jgi:hypothetical protein
MGKLLERNKEYEKDTYEIDITSWLTDKNTIKTYKDQYKKKGFIHGKKLT